MKEIHSKYQAAKLRINFQACVTATDRLNICHNEGSKKYIGESDYFKERIMPLPILDDKGWDSSLLTYRHALLVEIDVGPHCAVVQRLHRPRVVA